MRHSFKKLLALLLAMAMLFAFAACTQEDGGEVTPDAGTPDTSEGTDDAETSDDGGEAVSVDKEYTTDIVVVGGGGAGMSAAISAAQSGKEVIIIEKMGYLGGATMLSAGLVPAYGTAQQVEAGIDDSIDGFVRDMMRPNNYSVRQDLVYTVAEQSQETIEWMEEMGIKFSLITSALYYGQSNYRMHLPEGGGMALSTGLEDYMKAFENVTVMTETPGTGLATNADGHVTGVYADSADEGMLLINAESTILCTSGFGANEEMLEEYMPEIANAVPYVAPGATGEGIEWGIELGADIANMGAYQGHAMHVKALGKSISQGMANAGGIFVNVDGMRFTNEYNGYSELSPHIMAQPGGVAWLIVTDDLSKVDANFDSYVEQGVVVSADSASELATALGIDGEGLSETITEYRASIERGEDEFNRTKLPANFDGPYHAIEITPDLRHTQGGLVTDVAGHVLKVDGTLIPGLYAAGGVTEGFSSEGGAAYMSGNGLLQALIFGKIAGETASAETRDTAEVVIWEKVE